MTAMQRLPDDDPIMIAWEAYRKTDEAKNSRKWAQKIDIEQDTGGVASLTHRHLDGALWAVFLAGYTACKSTNE